MPPLSDSKNQNFVSKFNAQLEASYLCWSVANHKCKSWVL